MEGQLSDAYGEEVSPNHQVVTLLEIIQETWSELVKVQEEQK